MRSVRRAGRWFQAVMLDRTVREIHAFGKKISISPWRFATYHAPCPSYPFTVGGVARELGAAFMSLVSPPSLRPRSTHDCPASRSPGDDLGLLVSLPARGSARTRYRAHCWWAHCSGRAGPVGDHAGVASSVGLACTLARIL